MTEQEFYVDVPWGRIACISWGLSTDSPILLLHGYLDSAATFLPLLKYLPKNFYYVALDLPGHGKSNPLPLGPLVSYSCFIETLRRVIEHLKWEHFVLISHSLAFIIGNLYNNLYPYKITKMINLEPSFPISMYSTWKGEHSIWYEFMYGEYYRNYSRWTSRRNKKYTYDQAINLIIDSRKLNREQAAVVLSRVLEPVGNGLYRLTWEPCMKYVVGLPIPEEMLISIISSHPPPSLNIVAIQNGQLNHFEDYKDNLLNYFNKIIPNFLIYNVVGSHDVHITNPEKFADKIFDFLNGDVKNSVGSKL